jgi:hypothetical protein
LGGDAVQRSRQLTEALKRTHQALQQQLDRSAAALNALGMIASLILTCLLAMVVRNE